MSMEIKGLKELNEKDLMLTQDIEIPIKVKLSYEVDCDELNTYESADNLNDLMEDILASLKFNYDLYAKYEGKASLTEGALDLKNKMLEIFEEVGN